MILLVALACARPPVERWTGCLNEGAALELDPSLGVELPVEGPGVVLRIWTSWATVPWIVDNHTASLWFELPAPLAVGSHTVDAAEARYLETYRELPDVTGTVSVVEVLPDQAVVAVDVTLPAEAEVPPIVGQVAVRRVRGPRCWAP